MVDEENDREKWLVSCEKKTYIPEKVNSPLVLIENSADTLHMKPISAQRSYVDAVKNISQVVEITEDLGGDIKISKSYVVQSPASLIEGVLR